MVKKTAKKKTTKAKTTKKAQPPAAKKEAAMTAPVVDDEIETAPLGSGTNQIAAPSQKHAVTVQLSKALHSKLSFQSEDEGISLEEYIVELLAEGSVVRAWEIVERKIQMRGGQGQQQQQHQNQHQGNRNNNNRRGGGGNNQRRGGMQNNRYNNIMEDKAQFLEYVRNQERRSR